MTKNHRLLCLTALACILVIAAAVVGIYSSLQKRAESEARELMARALKSSPEQAEKLMREAIKLRPNDPLILFTLGETLNANDKAEEALKALERALEIAKKQNDGRMIQRRIQSALARLYEDMGEYEKAIACYKEGIALAPQPFPQRFAHRRLAELYRKKGDFASAAQEYGLAIRNGVGPNQPEMYFSAAICEARAGNPEKAFDYLLQLFSHRSLVAVRPGDGQTNGLYWNWISMVKNSPLMSEVRKIKGFEEAVASAEARARARDACVGIYKFPMRVPGFRREFPTSAEAAQTYARYAGFSRDVLLACANDDFVNADFEVGDLRRFGHGFGASYYYFQTPSQASDGVKMLLKLSLPHAEWWRLKWANHSLTDGVIGDETWSADDGNGNIRLVVRRQNFLAVLYCGEFDRFRSERVPPNIPPAMDSVARLAVEAAF